MHKEVCPNGQMNHFELIFFSICVIPKVHRVDGQYASGSASYRVRVVDDGGGDCSDNNNNNCYYYHCIVFLDGQGERIGMSDCV